MLPLAVKYNFAYIKPNIKHDHWSILKSNKAIYRTFLIDPIIIFCKNNSLKQLNGGNTIRNDKNIKTRCNKHNRKCTPCTPCESKSTAKAILLFIS